MKTLQQKQLDFLNDTINYFNINNRGINKDNHCSYEKGCAIGRHLTPKLCHQFDKIDASVFDIYYKLPTELQELGKNFLHQIQMLHDDKGNWNETGLSKQGKNGFNDIKKYYHL